MKNWIVMKESKGSKEILNENYETEAEAETAAVNMSNSDKDKSFFIAEMKKSIAGGVSMVYGATPYNGNKIYEV